MQDLNFEEVVSLIEAVGTKRTVMSAGVPGCGKTAVARKVAANLGLPFAYMDMANMSLGDMTMPRINIELHCTEFYPNEVLQLHTGKPIVLCMDEWTKGTKEVKNMSLPLALERRLGSTRLHPDTIVCATGNAVDNGVGDSIQAHQIDRFITVNQRNPTAQEWTDNFALEAGINPVVLTFVDQFPRVFESYKDDPSGDNPYIFNPKKQQRKYCSARSLEAASDVLNARDQMTGTTLMAGLQGAVGDATAADMLSFVNLLEALPSLDSVFRDPARAVVPDSPTARLMMTFNLFMASKPDNITGVMQYMTRFNNEMQALLVNKLMSSNSKAAWAAKCRGVMDTAQKLQHVF